MQISTRKKPFASLPTKFVQYASASYALGKLCATESRAEIVMINVGSGSGGFNINQVNGGVAVGNFQIKNDFPNSGAGQLYLFNQFGTSSITGLTGKSGLALGVTAIADASIKKFSAGATINGTTSFNESQYFTAFKSNGVTAANFTTNDYVGFQFGTAGNYHYGWLQTTWDGTNFQINSGAYESTANTAIFAGANAPVPEPGTLALGSLALLAGGGAAVRRYRKQRQSQSAAGQPTTEPAIPAD